MSKETRDRAIDPRFAQLPADSTIPLQIAHQLVHRSRSTVYGWAQTGKLVVTDSPDGQLVRVGDVRKCEASITRGRPPKRHAARSPEQ